MVNGGATVSGGSVMCGSQTCGINGSCLSGCDETM